MRTSRVIATPESRRSRIFSPGRPTNSSFSLLRRSHTTNPRLGIVCTVLKTPTTWLRPSSISSPATSGRHVGELPPAVEPLHDEHQLLHVVEALGRDVDHRRLHLHHPPPGDVHRQGRDVVEVRVRDEPRRRAHEVPRLRAEVEADVQFREFASRSAPRRATSPRRSTRRARAKSTAHCPPAARTSFLLPILG